MTKTPGQGTWDYHLLVYDAWNRLVRVWNGYDSLSEIKYDGLNQRIVKKGTIDEGENFETRAYYYNDHWQCVEEWYQNEQQEDQLQIDRQNVWGARYIDELVCYDRDTDEDGAIDERLYTLQDANYNVTALTGISGVVERYVYDAYGQTTVLNADFSLDAGNASDYGNTTLYTGRTLDTETGLMYYRNRYYHTGLGTFVSRDPTGYWGSQWNLYEYTGSRPLAFMDPLGEKLVHCGNIPGDLDQWIRVPDDWTGREPCGDILGFPWGPFPQTPDQAKVASICSSVTANLACGECTMEKCETAMAQFLNAVHNTWILNLFGRYIGPDTCSRWVRDLNSRIPDDFLKNPCISSYNIESHDIYANAGATSVHWTFYVTLCDGTKINADNNSWGGDDHIWIPPSPAPTPPNKKGLNQVSPASVGCPGCNSATK